MIESALASARNFIANRGRQLSIDGDTGLLWPLFFSDEPNPLEYEIDTCATALGFSATLCLDDGSAYSHELTQRALLTLMSLRRRDGSWPSIQVQPAAGRPAPMEGVVNDTIYALHALIDCGFFNPPYETKQPYFPSKYMSLSTPDERMKWIQQTIDWANQNRLGSGWYYTSTEYMANREQFSAAVGPTASMVLVLDRIVDAGARCERQTKVALLARTMRDDAIAWLQDVQHESGGFGRNQFDTPRIAHTLIALMALTCAEARDRRSTSAQRRAVDWLLANAKQSTILRMADIDCFDEYEQAIVARGTSLRKRRIAHENTLEPLVIRAFGMTLERGDRADFGRRRVARMSSRVFLLVAMLLHRQSKSGSFRGAFLSRRHLDSERYPVYWVYHSVAALLLVRALIDRKQISWARNLTRSLALRASIVLVAAAFYYELVNKDAIQLLSLVLLGIAINLASLLFTQE